MSAFAPAALMLIVGVSATSTSSLSLQDVLRMAFENAESHRIAQAEVAQAEARLREVWAGILPSLAVSGTYRRRAFEVAVTQNGNRRVLQARDALFGQARLTSTLFEARSLPDIGAAEKSVDQAQATLALRRFELAHDVAFAYIDVRVAEGVTQAATRRLDVARQEAAFVGQRAEAGLVSALDRDRAEIEALEAESIALQAERGRSLARLVLYQRVGTPVEARLLPVRAPPVAEAEDALLAEALAERPELHAARSAIEAAERQALAPWLDLVPSLNLDGVVTLTNEVGFNGRAANWNLALTLNWLLYDGGSRYAEAREAAASLQIRRLELSGLERQVRSEVESGLVEVRAAEGDLRVAEKRRSVARRYAEQIRARAARGLASAVEVADAAVEAFEAEVDAATTEAELARAALILRRSTGRLPLAPAGVSR